MGKKESAFAELLQDPSSRVQELFLNRFPIDEIREKISLNVPYFSNSIYDEMPRMADWSLLALRIGIDPIDISEVIYETFEQTKGQTSLAQQTENLGNYAVAQFALRNRKQAYQLINQARTLIRDAKQTGNPIISERMVKSTINNSLSRIIGILADEGEIEEAKKILAEIQSDSLYDDYLAIVNIVRYYYIPRRDLDGLRGFISEIDERIQSIINRPDIKNLEKKQATVNIARERVFQYAKEAGLDLEADTPIVSQNEQMKSQAGLAFIRGLSNEFIQEAYDDVGSSLADFIELFNERKDREALALLWKIENLPALWSIQRLWDSLDMSDKPLAG